MAEKKNSTKQLVIAWLGAVGAGPVGKDAEASKHFETKCKPALASQADDLTPEALNKWFVETVHNSPISRNTEICNSVLASKDELAKQLANK